MPTSLEVLSERRRASVLATLAWVEAVRTEKRLQAFLEASGTGGVWEQSFVDYLAARRHTGFLTGEGGPDLVFFVNPSSGDGFWLVEQRAGARGKGWLSVRDVQRLLALAAEKGLWRQG